MKNHQPLQTRRFLAAVAGGLALFAGAAHAAPFLYSPGDLVLALRQSGNAFDYVVNLGKATNFNALPAGTSLALTNFRSDLFKIAFPSENGVKWSVAGANRPPVDPNYPLQTIWVTAPRLDPAVRSPAWLRKGQFVQGAAASQIDAVGANGAAASSSQPSGPDNTVTGVVIPLDTSFAISPLIGDAGDYVGTFQGNVESTTAEDFDGDAGNVSRSDLYELLPGTTAAGTANTPARYLGYFELRPDGTLTFSTSAPPPPKPNITKIARDGNVTTVSFTTVNGASYQLRATDATGLTTPVSTWTAGATIAGNGSERSLQDTSTSPIRFFTIEAKP